jgi:hypothetical protein
MNPGRGRPVGSKTHRRTTLESRAATLRLKMQLQRERERRVLAGELARRYGFFRGNSQWRALNTRRGTSGRVVLEMEAVLAARGDGASEGYEVGR